MRIPLPSDFLSRPLAHRGFHDAAKGRPENSLAAIRAAITVGYGIEIDVQPSADNVPMVFHDEDLERMTGQKGRIKDHTAEDLAKLRLIGTDEPIPTLAEVLRTVVRRVPLLIEVKDQDGALGKNVGPFEDAIGKVLSNYGGNVAGMSFNPDSLMALRRAARGLPLGLVTCSFAPEDWPGVPAERLDELRAVPGWDTDLIAAGFVAHDHNDILRPRMSELRSRGAKILCWTCRSIADERKARAYGNNVIFEGYNAALT